MKILVNILIVILSIVALLLIAALFIKKDYSIQREIIINKPKQEVFSYIKTLKNQNSYNKWWMMDPNVQKEYRGIDGTVGFVAAWDSKVSGVGKGEQEIKNIKEGERIDCEIRFEKPFEAVASTSMTTDSVAANQTKVTWVFAGRYNYPMNLMNLFVGKVLGGDLQTSLENLKKVVEK
jgi:uncharacterized protein YndB with AHSA1/START domain